MTMKTKYGVKIKGIKPEMVLGLLIAEGYFDSMGISEMVVTSATDGKHGRRV